MHDRVGGSTCTMINWVVLHAVGKSEPHLAADAKREQQDMLIKWVAPQSEFLVESVYEGTAFPR